METWLFVAILLAFFSVTIGWVTRFQAAFVIRIRNGFPVATRGTVTAAFLAAIAEIARDSGVESGEIRGVYRGREIALRFSRELPSGFRQRLRNWWVAEGWRAR